MVWSAFGMVWSAFGMHLECSWNAFCMHVECCEDRSRVHLQWFNDSRKEFGIGFEGVPNGLERGQNMFYMVSNGLERLLQGESRKDRRCVALHKHQKHTGCKVIGTCLIPFTA